jgi:hypothetical protein
MPQLEHEKSLSPGGMQASKSRVLTRQRKREKEKEIERERKKERERERERERQREGPAKQSSDAWPPTRDKDVERER